jgi:hypothetical protein
MTRAFRISVRYSALIILTLIVLNRLTSGYPWCIYPIFGILWWPLSAYFAGRKQPFQYALCGTALLWAMFLLTYLFSTFGAHLWFVYPMMAVFWWPLSVWGAMVGAKKFSVVAAQYIIAMVLAINLLTSWGTWWWIYPAIGVIWWPLILHMPRQGQKEGEQS